MKFLMTARKKDGDIMSAVFEADNEAQARDLIQQADNTLEVISVEPVTSKPPTYTPGTPTPTGTGQNPVGKPAGCVGIGALIFIAIRVLLLGVRCAADNNPKQPQPQPPPFIPRPVPIQRGQPDGFQPNQGINRALQRIDEISKLNDTEMALRQRMQRTDDEEIRDKCRSALDEIAKLKALQINGADEEWEQQSLVVRKAVAQALPRNAPTKGTAKTSAGTGKKK
jgi:hypothetical protein